jgi:branched-chain amino acid transport system ATP-binding protein
VKAPLLSIRNLSINFGGLTALNKVNLDLGVNEIVGLIGPNGAGKTTLFNSISGLASGTGKIELNGSPHNWPKPHELAELGIARTLQGVGLFPEMTVLENVMVGATKYAKAGLIRSALGFDRHFETILKDRAISALAKVSCTSIAGQKISELPYPTTKRVAIARALVSDPRILLLDEPAGGLGAEDIAWLNKFIKAISKQCSVLIVEHHMDVIMSVCDRVYVLDFGEVIAEGKPEIVKRDPAVIAAYLGSSAVK